MAKITDYIEDALLSDSDVFVINEASSDQTRKVTLKVLSDYLNGNASEDPNFEVNGELTVGGETTLNDNVTINGNLNLTGDNVELIINEEVQNFLNFGDGANQVAEWAEGNSDDMIPQGRLQAYNTIQDSDGLDADQRFILRFSENFSVDDSNTEYTLISHSNKIDVGDPVGVTPGEVNVQGFASSNLPHINLIGAGVSNQDVGQVVFQHYHQIEDETNTLFKIIGGAENHQIDPDDSDGYDEDGYLKFVAVESRDGAADNQVEIASFHTDKIELKQEIYAEDIPTGTIVSGGRLGLDSNNKIVKSSSVDQFADQQELEDFISNKSDFRSDIGAGTSSLVIGTTATTAKAGNYTPTQSELETAITDNSGFRTSIGAGTSNLVLGATSTTAKAGNYTPTQAEIETAITDQNGFRTSIGAGTSNLTIGTTSTTAKAGDYTPTQSEIETAITDKSGFRTSIGSLVIGTTSTTAKAGNYTPTKAEVDTALGTSDADDSHFYGGDGTFKEVIPDQVNNQRSGSTDIKFWRGTIAQYNALWSNGDGTGTFNGDDDTVYFTT